MQHKCFVCYGYVSCKFKCLSSLETAFSALFVSEQGCLLVQLWWILVEFPLLCWFSTSRAKNQWLEEKWWEVKIRYTIARVMFAKVRLLSKGLSQPHAPSQSPDASKQLIHEPASVAARWEKNIGILSDGSSSSNNQTIVNEDPQTGPRF